MNMEPKKEDRRVRKTKKQLRDGLAQLLEKKSIRDITVKELVDTVDINRSTFYLHYSDIYDMLKKIETELFQEIKDALSEYPITPDESAKPFILVMFQIMDRNRPICKALVGPNGDIAFVSRMEEMVGLEAVQVIEPLFKVEETRKKYIYAYCLNGSVGMVKSWLLDDCKETPEQMTEIFFDMIRNTLDKMLDN